MRFGYRDGAARLGWLAQRVTGPRASAAAAHASALATDDGDALLAASSHLEEMEDLPAAADAYRAGQRLGVHGRADLAAAVGGEKAVSGQPDVPSARGEAHAVDDTQTWKKSFE